MRVLGISPLDKDSTVSFVEDGRVVFACGEERLTRVKLQAGFPDAALALGFARTGWTAAAVDVVAYAFFDWRDEAKLIRESLAADAAANRADPATAAAAAYRAAMAAPYTVDRGRAVPGLDTEAAEFVPRKTWWKRAAYDRLARSPRGDALAHARLAAAWEKAAVADHRRWSGELAAGLARHGLAGTPLKRFHHHDTHAANAFYAGPFETALVVTLDGYGSGCCGGVYTAGPEGIIPRHRFRFPNSLGIFYEHVTSGLGFKPGRHEGKIVGLAAYGDPHKLAPLLLDRIAVTDGDVRIRNGLNHFLARALAGKYAKRDVAAAYQYVLDDVARRVVAYWAAKTGLRNVVMSGGVHANVKLNQRVRETPGVDAVFVYPNMGDGGCGTGAAMLATGHATMPRGGYDTIYYGPEYSEAEIAAALAAERLTYERPADGPGRLAELLAGDAIVARFAGRMEYGPRALGNRSVLYPARRPEVNQWLNHQLGRTEFMPFAPVCPAADAPRLFNNLAGCEKTAEFMTVTFDCTAEMKAHSPAAVHVDGTARPQLVTPAGNPGFHAVLTAYKERTGVPVLINTSFNMHEEPIICAPADAVRGFLVGNIDYLAAGPFVVPHPRLAENRAARAAAAIVTPP